VEPARKRNRELLDKYSGNGIVWKDDLNAYFGQAEKFFGPSLKGKRVLNLGSGDSAGREKERWLAAMLRDRGADVVDLDHRPPKRRPAVRADLLEKNLPFKEKVFDYVVSTQVFERMGCEPGEKQARNLAREIKRVLKPGGGYFQYTLNEPSLKTKHFEGAGKTVKARGKSVPREDMDLNTELMIVNSPVPLGWIPWLRQRGHVLKFKKNKT